VHVTPDGTVSLVGTTNKLEDGFARRFGRLVERVARALREDSST
jgi:hypothetical protein